MQVIIIKWWIIKLLKTLCFCTSSFEINQWNVHWSSTVSRVQLTINTLKSLLHICLQGPISLKVHELIIQILKNSCCSQRISNDQIISQFCTCHDSWAVMARANLWPDTNIRIKIRTTKIFTRFGLWAHKLFVKWVPCLSRNVWFMGLVNLRVL